MITTPIVALEAPNLPSLQIFTKCGVRSDTWGMLKSKPSISTVNERYYSELYKELINNQII